MRELTKAESVFCKHYEEIFKCKNEWITSTGEHGGNILIAKTPAIVHTKIEKAVMINPQITNEVLLDMRYLMAQGHIVLPFTDEEIITDIKRQYIYYMFFDMSFRNKIYDYGLYCIDHAEKMEEVLRGAW